MCWFVDIQPPYRRSDSSDAGRYPSLFDSVDDDRQTQPSDDNRRGVIDRQSDDSDRVRGRHWSQFITV